MVNYQICVWLGMGTKKDTLISSFITQYGVKSSLESEEVNRFSGRDAVWANNGFEQPIQRVFG
jgi:hypothetical protein